MEVKEVAAPAAGVNLTDELLEVAPAAVVRRLGAEAKAGAHEVLPVGEHGLDVLRMVVGRVARLVVGLHVARVGDAAAGCRRGPVLVDVVRHALGVGQAVFACGPRVAPRGVEGIVGRGTGVAGETFLLGILPQEYTV